MAFCLYEALFPLFLILYMDWVFRDRGVGWLPFTCVFRPPSGSLLRACFHLAYGCGGGGVYRGADGGGYLGQLRGEISSLLERLDERSLDRQREDTIAALR